MGGAREASRAIERSTTTPPPPTGTRVLPITIDRALEDYFPRRSFIQVYFEAVHNAVDAGATEITITIESNGKVQEPKFTLTIEDNGQGFTAPDFEQFKVLQTAKDRDHKGLGRLIYLAYFKEVEVQSIFDDGTRRRRTFTFSKEWGGGSELSVDTGSTPCGSKLTFREFTQKQLKTYDDLRPSKIKEKLRDHFYPLLHSRKHTKRPLRIQIDLLVNGAETPSLFPEQVVLEPDELPVLERRVIKDAPLDLYADIIVWYRVEPQSKAGGLNMIASVDDRTVPLNGISSATIPVGTSAFFLLESKLFTGMTDNARERLVLSGKLTLDDLMRVLKPAISKILHENLPEIGQRNQRTRGDFQQRYPHLLGLFDNDSVGLIDRDEAVKAAQLKFFAKQRDVLGSDPNDDVMFEQALEISSRALTEYVLYREHIIKRLDGTNSADLESALHDIIVPQRTRFEDAALVQDIYRNNVWLLDDKFMSFRTVLSEKEMGEVIAAITNNEEREEKTRPDITMVFSADPSSAEKVDVVVVEVKRRGVNLKESTYAAAQLQQRARLLVDHCPNIQRMWYYAVVDIDDELNQFLRDDSWISLYSKDRVYCKTRVLDRTGQNEKVEVPTFFVSFDAIVKDSKARNHAFLEILRSGFQALEKQADEPGS